MAGIFISRGMTVAVPPGGLQIRTREDGQLDANPTIHVRFDVCPTWIQLANQHRDAALAARVARQAAWGGTDEDAKAVALEREFEASMQATMAAAIAIDAFHAILQPHVSLPPSMVERWRKGRTARYSQVTEVIRRAFRLKPKGVAVLKERLKEIYRIRDLAVHPSGRIGEPLVHPELGVGVEWRFTLFRGVNAEQVVNHATWTLWDLCYNGQAADKQVATYVDNLKRELLRLFPDGHPIRNAANGQT